VATVSFTQNLRRHLDSELPPLDVSAGTVATVFDQIFGRYPRLRGYLLDDQGGLRKHVVVFLDGETIGDRRSLTDPVPENCELFVAQALSGG
jgi:hypothetical protein